MAERSVVVRLRAVTSDYTAAMQRAGQATTKISKDLASGTKKAATEIDQMGVEATIAGAALLGIGITAIAASTRFDKSMSKVKAVSGATAGEMDRLRQSALDAGEATVFSASEAAEAQAELAKAGVKTADILGGALSGSLDLAAAGGLGLAESATIAAQAMNVFGLKGRDVSRIADTLAAGANKSAADVSQLGQALQQAGLVADQAGLGLEDTVGILSAFADRALIGSDAGTSLKTMLQRLTPQSDAAAAKMAELGISAFDASGEFVGLDKFAGQLQTALADLTPEARTSALGIIFGSDAVRGANVLYDLGEKGVREYTKAVSDQGAASRMAGELLDNLAGDFEALSGSIETTFIKSGSGANALLRDMTQAATQAVNFVGDLPGPILAAGVAAATAGGAFLLAAPRIVAFNAALAASPTLSRAASAAIKGLGPAIAATAVVAFALDIHATNEELTRMEKELDDLYRTLDKDIDSGGITTLRDRIDEISTTLRDPGPIRLLENLAQTITGAEPMAVRLSDALREGKAELADYQAAVGEVAYALGVDFDRAIQLLDDSGANLNGTTKQTVAQVKAYVDATQDGGVATVRAAAAMDTLADDTAAAEDALKAYADQWDATIGVMLGSSDASIAAERALDDLTASLKKNGNQWNINTEKGRENRSAFNDLIASAGEVAKKKLEEGASVEEADAAYQKYLTRLLKAKGLTREQREAIQDLIRNGYDRIPEAKVTKVEADVSGAKQDVRDLKAWIAAQRATIKVDAAAGTQGTGGGRVVIGQASGGFVDGYGTSTSDSNLRALSRGEFVTRSAVAQSNRPLMSAINDGRFGDAARYLSERGSGGSSGLSIGSIQVQAAPGERAEESLPRALRREAFLNGLGG
jgi:TP901 family phage tail tape measure protein